MAITCNIFECNALHYNYVMRKKCPLQITFHYFENVIHYNYITITITITPGLYLVWSIITEGSILQQIHVYVGKSGTRNDFITVKGVTGSGYEKNNFPECVFGLNIIFELFPFVDITHTSYYISITFNFIFFI